MKQYEPCIQNDNNNNNNNIIIIIKWKKKIKRGQRGRREESVGEKKIFYFFLFIYFSDLRKLDRRFSSGLKAKLIHVTRVTRGYQNLGVSSNSTR